MKPNKQAADSHLATASLSSSLQHSLHLVPQDLTGSPAPLLALPMVTFHSPSGTGSKSSVPGAVTWLHRVTTACDMSQPPLSISLLHPADFRCQIPASIVEVGILPKCNKCILARSTDRQMDTHTQTHTTHSHTPAIKMTRSEERSCL